MADKEIIRRLLEVSDYHQLVRTTVRETVPRWEQKRWVLLLLTKFCRSAPNPSAQKFLNLLEAPEKIVKALGVSECALAEAQELCDYMREKEAPKRGSVRATSGIPSVDRQRGNSLARWAALKKEGNVSVTVSIPVTSRTKLRNLKEKLGHLTQGETVTYLLDRPKV